MIRMITYNTMQKVLCHFGSLLMEFMDGWAEGDSERVIDVGICFCHTSTSCHDYSSNLSNILCISFCAMCSNKNIWLPINHTSLDVQVGGTKQHLPETVDVELLWNTLYVQMLATGCCGRKSSQSFPRVQTESTVEVGPRQYQVMDQNEVRMSGGGAPTLLHTS